MLNKGKLLIVNQAANYLTIGLCNTALDYFSEVSLMTGSVHSQGEELSREIKIDKIPRWNERPLYKKLFSFFVASILIIIKILLKYRNYKILFVSVPPFSYLFNLILPNRCYTIIWDVYPDILKAVGLNEKKLTYRIWGFLNKLSLKRHEKVFTITPGMVELLSEYVIKEKILLTPIWSIFTDKPNIKKEENPFVKMYELQGKFVVQYSGNIGYTHRIDVLIELAELLIERKEIVFQIIGRGPRVPYLKNLVNNKNLPNVIFLDFQSDEMFPYSLAAADIGTVVLDEKASKGSVPSKCYNLMAYGIPSLYFASFDSELARYTRIYDHGRCFIHSELVKARDFILNLYSDSIELNRYSANSIAASRNYTRNNALNIVSKI